VDASQSERVVVTRHGRPAAVLVGVEGRDLEDLALQMSPGFWRMIERRRVRWQSCSAHPVNYRHCRARRDSWSLTPPLHNRHPHAD